MTPTPSSRTPAVVSTPSISRPAASRTTPGSSVGPRSVSERVSVEKSYRRTLITTVRPDRPAALSRCTHRSARRAISSCTRVRSVTSSWKVSSTDTDFASRSATTGRSSWPVASAYSPAPCALPSSRTSSASPASAVSATVPMPARRSVSAVAGPTPGIVRTGMGPSSSSSVPGSIRTSPSGLAASEAILASILDPASPTEPLSPVAAWMSRRSRSPTARICAGVAEGGSAPPASRSTNASSRLSGSTSGDSAPSSSITRSLTWR